MSTLLGTLRFLNQQKPGGGGLLEVPSDLRSSVKNGNLYPFYERKREEEGGEVKSKGSTTPMVTPTFCMNSPVLPEILTTDAIGLQSLLPEAEFGNDKHQRSLRLMIDKKPRPTEEELGALLSHMSQKSDFQISFGLKKRNRENGAESNLEKKLKTDSCKSLMLPQNTPPFRAKSKPLPGIKPSVMRNGSTQPDDKDESGTVQVNGNCGSSCHQCKSRRALHKLFFCSNQGNMKRPKDKRHMCRKKYCDQCLEKFYHEKPPTRTERPTWLCPACRTLCCCAACRRQKAKLADDPRTMSPATSLACGLVFGDMLDGKNKLTLEEARASVNKGVQKQISLQRMQQEKLNRSRSERELKQRQRGGNLKQLPRRQMSRKKKASVAEKVAKPKRSARQASRQQNQMKVAHAQVATAAAAAAAAAKGHWFHLQQHQQVQLLAKFKQAQQQNGQVHTAQLLAITGGGLQRGFVIPKHT
mmetsp:Transcript_10180/g.19549  ORF Transcript_10180/g.19549 Transcript_10180/m.19549 type:complete len:471 (-) Transcript_10180:394-1806(-)